MAENRTFLLCVDRRGGLFNDDSLPKHTPMNYVLIVRVRALDARNDTAPERRAEHPVTLVWRRER